MEDSLSIRALSLIPFAWIFRGLLLWQRLGKALERRLRLVLSSQFSSVEKKTEVAGIQLLGDETSILDKVVAKYGKGVCGIADVGARWGAEKSWWDLRPLAFQYGFEPDAEECQRLNKVCGQEARYFPMALGAQEGEATLHVTRAPASSSLYFPDTNLIKRFPQLIAHEPQKQVSVQLTTLDQWRKKENHPWIAFIKLDTQGSELDILKGSTESLKDCIGIETEVEFSAMYQGQPVFSDLDSYLRKQGFHLWALHELKSYSERPEEKSPWHISRFRPASQGRVYWCNAVYFRDYQEHGQWTRGENTERKLCVLAAFLEAAGDKAAAQSALEASQNCNFVAMKSHEV